MTAARVARSAGGWLLLASLFYAPWALGCVQPWTVRILAAMTLSSCALWAIGLVLRHARPKIPRVAAACIALLLLQGCWMILNAHGRYLGDSIIPIDSHWPGGPGAVDGPVCRAMLLQITAVLAALIVACDLASEHVWRWRLIATLGATAFSIATWGLLQKIGLLPALAHREYQESVFATFDYHGNAGAFLNLGIPAVFALAIHRHRQGGVAALLICVAAAMANVSRAASAIAIGIVLALVAWKHFARRAPVATRPSRWLAPGLILAFVAATLVAGSGAWRRWNTVPSMEVENSPRLIMLQIAAPMAVDAGFFGDGPGSFKLIYPDSPHLIRDLYKRWKVQPYRVGEETSIYSYVHNDYLQFIIEWGWIGASLWTILIATAAFNGWRAYIRGAADERLIIAASLIALSGVLVHALVDWPLQVASLQLDVAVYLAILLASPQCASY